MYRLSVVILLFSSLLIPAARAQSAPNATLRGTVADNTGALIPDATISAKPSGNESAFTTTTNHQGEFSLSGLPAGTYILTVGQLGFNKVYKTVNVTSSQNIDLAIVLSVNSANQSVTVTAQSGAVLESPTGQTIASVERQDFKDAANLNISDAMALIPGVTVNGGNGPRDVSISLRGSNNTSVSSVRNTQTFEDGFPVTQPDGQGRSDLMDPHAYAGVDTVQGPSSTLYGNYATGGMLNFHLRPGGDVMGVEVGTDAGSFGFLNDYLTAGYQGDSYQYTIFLSNERAREYTPNTEFNVITANALASFTMTPRDRATVKFIDNEMDTKLSIRLSLSQFKANPYQAGCDAQSAATLAQAAGNGTVANGCASVNLYVNGFNGTKVALTADQAGLGRHDRRTIVGGRWEHDFSHDFTWSTEFVWDNRDINQPTSSTTGRGTYPSFNVISQGTRNGPLFGHSSVTYVGGYFNLENYSSYSYNLTPAGNGTQGAQTATTFGRHYNVGFHGREEFSLSSRLTAVAGFAGEFTNLLALDTIYTYPTTATPTQLLIQANKNFFNIAPEAALLYRVSDSLLLHSRLGTGYGTPQGSNLFITQAGTYGNNTQLNAQKNVGIDFGGEWSAASNLKVSAAGFYEHFIDQLVSQSAGVNAVGSYTFNAPSAAHRGMIAGVDWRPAPKTLKGLRFRASYTLDRQIYKRYTENLSTATVAAGYLSFVRNGNSIPGVPPNNLNARLVYDQTSRRFGTLGAYVETNFRDTFWLDNANLLPAPSSTLINFDLHYDPAPGHGAWSRLHFYYDLQNAANRANVASASNITDSINSSGVENGYSALVNTTGTIFAGLPRASYGGVRVKF